MKQRKNFLAIGAIVLVAVFGAGIAQAQVRVAIADAAKTFDLYDFGSRDSLSALVTVGGNVLTNPVVSWFWEDIDGYGTTNSDEETVSGLVVDSGRLTALRAGIWKVSAIYFKPLADAADSVINFTVTDAELEDIEGVASNEGVVTLTVEGDEFVINGDDETSIAAQIKALATSNGWLKSDVDGEGAETGIFSGANLSTKIATFRNQLDAWEELISTLKTANTPTEDGDDDKTENSASLTSLIEKFEKLIKTGKAVTASGAFSSRTVIVNGNNDASLKFFSAERHINVKKDDKDEKGTLKTEPLSFTPAFHPDSLSYTLVFPPEYKNNGESDSIYFHLSAAYTGHRDEDGKRVPAFETLGNDTDTDYPGFTGAGIAVFYKGTSVADELTEEAVTNDSETDSIFGLYKASESLDSFDFEFGDTKIIYPKDTLLFRQQAWLASGDNHDFKFTLTAENGETREYSVNVIRTGDARLKSVTASLKDGSSLKVKPELKEDEVYDDETLDIEVQVPHGKNLSDVTVEAELKDDSKENNARLAYSAAGENRLQITVTAAGNARIEYTVTAKYLSTDTLLSFLVPSAGALKPAFSPEVFDYEVIVPKETKEIHLFAGAVLPAKPDRTDTLVALSSDTTLVPIVVTAEDTNVTGTYRVTVIRHDPTGVVPAIASAAHVYVEGDRFISVIADAGERIGVYSPTGELLHAFTSPGSRISVKVAPSARIVIVKSSAGWAVKTIVR